VTPGAYTISRSTEGFTQRTQQVTVVVNESKEVDIALTPNLTTINAFAWDVKTVIRLLIFL